ncbi:alpha/beta fold hydrolase [Candidatus Chlorohelix sp.]|uniref:PHA/PHB synthase family protein n=1 Tax=Candidatus Chlorohelix sp. TaxID=3139201 RepID=UPI0030412FA4
MENTMRSPEVFSNIDRMVHAWAGRFNMGISPSALMLAYLDWLVHLGTSPGKQAELLDNMQRNMQRLMLYASHSADPNAEPVIKPLPQDTRFNGAEWQKWPFNLYSQTFLMTEQWWHYATTGIPGVSRHNEDFLYFAARQLLDTASPSNYVATNPEVLKTTMLEGGANLVKGTSNFIEDWQRTLQGQKPAGAEKFKVGKNVAITPGKVIYRNRLIELIQYSPTTPNVYAEPVLIVPACIMKYYILDLSPQNSMVKYLVDNGHTVFLISWKNPEAHDRDLSMEDYRTLGIMAALDVVSAVVPDRKIHALGYCIGGTFLTIAASAMARDGDDRLQSVTLLAAQTDFTEAGELMLFIDEGQVNYLEDIMWNQGYLDIKQMAGAFQLLRSSDLIWSRMINEYLLGHAEQLNDLMAWNTDGTRLPYRMHSEYLRSLFLNNALFEGHFKVGDRPIVLSDIRAPIFAVATSKDHVAPWRSVYKLMLPVDTDVTFVLTSGGHNSGIVSEPGHANRSYQIATRYSTDKYVDPDIWQAVTPVQKGSWWSTWQAWLGAHSSGKVEPPSIGAGGHYPVLADAPGTYVLQQ